MINWENTKIALSELKPWTKNPRQSTKTQARRILKSFERFGQVQPVSIGPDNSVYDGHQRLSALLTVYGTDYQIDARRADRELTDDERRALVITLHAGATGEWNWDELSSWQPAEMMDAGFDAELLQEWKRDTSALGNFLGAEEINQDDDYYSKKIEAPIYRPTGSKPDILELIDTKKVDELLNEIDNSNIPETEKTFLRIAAYRHAVINFKLTAEYYAHSDASTQKLFENNALVIIDFDKAIELGFVKLSEEIVQEYKLDYGIA